MYTYMHYRDCVDSGVGRKGAYISVINPLSHSHTDTQLSDLHFSTEVQQYADRPYNESMFCNSWSIISAIALSLSEAFLNNSLSEMVHSDMDLCGVGETKLSKAKQRCVMGVGMCLYAQLVQTKNK